MRTSRRLRGHRASPNGQEDLASALLTLWLRARPIANGRRQTEFFVIDPSAAFLVGNMVHDAVRRRRLTPPLGVGYPSPRHPIVDGSRRLATAGEQHA